MQLWYWALDAVWKARNEKNCAFDFKRIQVKTIIFQQKHQSSDSLSMETFQLGIYGFCLFFLFYVGKVGIIKQWFMLGFMHRIENRNDFCIMNHWIVLIILFCYRSMNNWHIHVATVYFIYRDLMRTVRQLVHAALASRIGSFFFVLLLNSWKSAQWCE